MADEEVPPPPPPEDPPQEEAPPAKRQKTSTGGSEVAAALVKITAHISSAAKFRKAAALLRELIRSDALDPSHANALFEALRAAMLQPERAVQPELTLEYQRLFIAASGVAEIFSARQRGQLDALHYLLLSLIFSVRQRSQLDVYGLWGVLRGQLLTDDSFVFNRALGQLRQVKESVGHLPEAAEGDDEALSAALARLEREREEAEAKAKQAKAARDGAGPEEPHTAAAAAAAERGGGSAAAGEQRADRLGSGEEAGAAAALGAAPGAAASGDAVAEADPFQLDAIVAAPPQPKPPPRPKAVVWGARECLALKRAALLDCIATAQTRYGLAWAKTSVDLAIEVLHKNRERFAPAQNARINAFVRFVKDERAKRRQGPSAAERRRDVTSFEAARSEWGREKISIRSAVGGEGDHHSEVWLG